MLCRDECCEVCGFFLGKGNGVTFGFHHWYMAPVTSGFAIRIHAFAPKFKRGIDGSMGEIEKF
jgi:hypothetical protein